jgi:hypothetical protein
MFDNNIPMIKKSTASKGLGVAAALAGVAAAGYYFYASPEAKQHRKIATKWASTMKSDVLKQAKALKNIDRKSVEAIIMNAQKTYKGLKNMDHKEVERAARELKMNWQEIVKEVGKGASTAKKTAKKVVTSAEKAVKKTVKKVAKKVS